MGAGSSSTPRHDAAGADSRFVTIAGVVVHHRVTDGDDPAVVLLHHTYGNVRTWRHVQDRLGTDVRSVAFDRPGFGLTQRPRRRDWNGANPYTRAFAVRLTVGLLDHLGIDRAVLVGSSLGGTVALETVAANPQRVAGLVLLSPAITGDVGAPPALRPWLRTAPARAVGSRLIRRLARGLTRERIGQGWADASRVDDDDVAAYADPLHDPDWPRGLWEVFTAEPPPMLVDVLGRIDVPTVVAAGDHDRVVRPDASRETAAAIPTATFRLLADAGHTPQEERPDAVVGLVHDVLRTVRR